MNGNRGAKGSIKDRLISMLYRLRYQKKVLKESEYTVPRKKKQVEYLENLQLFDDTENVNLLDEKDIDALREIEYTAYFEKIGSEQLEFRLSRIESKNSELDDIIDIKKEVKKTKEEIIILDEVSKFVSESLDSIDELTSEVEVLKVYSKEKNQNTEQLEIRYKELRKKVDKLKSQFDMAKEKYDLSEFSILESIKLIDSIENYKSISALNEMEMMLKVCKKEMNKIEGITIVYENTNKTGSNISHIKEEQRKAKIKFNKSKEKVSEITSIQNKLVEELSEQQHIIDDMYEKASYFEKKLVKEVYYVGYGKLISSLFRIAGGIVTLPLSGLNIFGIALGSTMINKGLKQMNKSLEAKERFVIDYKYEDISNKISNIKDKLEYTNLILSDSLEEIRKLKINFKNYFKEFDKVLPEYKGMLEKVEALESKLLNQQERINKMGKKVEKAKEVNHQKLKKIGKL